MKSPRNLPAGFFFGVELLYLVLLLIGAGLFAKWDGFKDVFPKTIGTVPLPVMWFGALGAVTIGLYGTFFHNRDWDASYNFWHLARPFTGAVLGLIGYLIFTAVIRRGMLRLVSEAQRS